MADDATTFSAEEAVVVQRELRRALGLDAERFPLPVFIGMISDEVEQFRTAGRSDADVAAVIEGATGRRVNVAEIVRFYAPPELRRQGGGHD